MVEEGIHILVTGKWVRRMICQRCGQEVGPEPAGSLVRWAKGRTRIGGPQRAWP